MKVNIIGTYFGSSGYDSHTRQLALALNKLCEVSITTQRPDGWHRLMEDDEYKMISRNPQEADINIHIGLPFNWKHTLSDGKPFIGFCVWEGDKVPKSWIEIFYDERVKQIWVPSTHVRNAIWNTINDTEQLEKIKNKIKIIPHGVDSKIFYPNKKVKDNILKFIASKGWPYGSRDRGGLSFLLKAYLEEFTINDNVEMIVKINSAYGMTQQILDKNLKELNIKNKNNARIKFSIDTIEYDKLNEVYNFGDVFCSTSLAEGFNLNILEAMACGLPAITTMFGGMSDFCNDKNSWLLKEGKLVEADWDIMYEGVSWKIPSISEIRKTLREVYNNQNEIINKSKEAIKTSKEYTWDNSAKIALKHLEILT